MIQLKNAGHMGAIFNVDFVEKKYPGAEIQTHDLPAH